MNRRALNLMNSKASALLDTRALGGSERRGQPHWKKLLTPGFEKRIGCGFAHVNSGAALLVFMAVVGSGCSGIHATKSISPLDFILPGLLRHTPPSPMDPNAPPELAPVDPDLPLAQTQPHYSS